MQLRYIMALQKKQQEKARLHSRNKNRENYDLNALITAVPELAQFIIPNKFGVKSVDFANPVAVKLLNQALLKYYYGIKNWDFPDENLCPPIPGRADYIHHVADLLGEKNGGSIPTGNAITCLDVGVGASCIYPIIGATEYKWNFIGSDTNPRSVASAQKIVQSNASIKDKIQCRLQDNQRNFFHGIISKFDSIDMVVCNPPFHSSIEEAQKGTRRKVHNLSGRKEVMPERNFSGLSSELIYAGGEYKFVKNMIGESEKFSTNCYWFSTLVSKQSNLKGFYKLLDRVGAVQVKTIPMGTGNKSSRIVAWSFLSEDEQAEWRRANW